MAIHSFFDMAMVFGVISPKTRITALMLMKAMSSPREIKRDTKMTVAKLEAMMLTNMLPTRIAMSNRETRPNILSMSSALGFPACFILRS